MPYNSLGTVAFWCQRSRQNCDEVAPIGSVKYRWGRLKSVNFYQYLDPAF